MQNQDTSKQPSDKFDLELRPGDQASLNPLVEPDLLQALRVVDQKGGVISLKSFGRVLTLIREKRAA